MTACTVLPFASVPVRLIVHLGATLSTWRQSPAAKPCVRSRCVGALLQAVHQLAGDWHAGHQNVTGQRFGDVEGLAVGATESAVVQVMMVGTVGVHEMGR